MDLVVAETVVEGAATYCGDVFREVEEGGY